MIMLSIFEAENRNKAGSEDILTSRFFGIMDIVNKKVLLKQFLSILNIPFIETELTDYQFSLWENYGDCIPDAVIESKDTLIFVESKLDAPISEDQLKREFVAVSSSRKKSFLICISKDFDLPTEIKNVREEIDVNIKWISWKKLYAFLSELTKSDSLNQTEIKLIENLILIFEINRLRGFKGFKKDNYEKIATIDEELKLFNNEISIFIEEISSILAVDGINSIRTGNTSFTRDGRGTVLDSPEEWRSSQFTFAYNIDGWDFESWRKSYYLFLRFHFYKPELWVGYKLRVEQDDQFDLLVIRKEKLVEKLKEINDIIVVYDWTDESSIEDLSVDDFEEENIDFYLIEFVFKIKLEDMESRRLLQIIRENMNILLNLVIDVKLTPIDT